MKRLKRISASAYLTNDELDRVWEIAERYNTSSPVSGDWDSETSHEMHTIADELNISVADAAQIMIDELGFNRSDFATLSSTKVTGRRSKKVECADYVDVNGHLGAVGEEYTEDELRTIYDNCKGNDPSIVEYDTYDKWKKATLPFLEHI